ncbi:transglutaminase-like cysteine peptidase [Caulobacter sp. X]|uniref:transglutaminase-like cysteine peptidase n=1 Tax=Caulobacter sp. X TaxID=2048901 RepID=UPI000C14D48A|nr:transglutaminase-like cysteine peptidase [Caulobacter sp. X]PIC01785.1 cysteine protease [Caulobacter sp. X]
MLNTRNIVSGLISAVALMAGVNAHAGSMPFMPRGGGMSAPMGFAELCRRDLATCGLPQSQLALMGLETPSVQPLTSSVGASPAHAFLGASAPSQDQAAELAPIVASEVAAPAAQSAVAVAAQPDVNASADQTPASATVSAWLARGEREQLKLLNQINQAVNRDVKKASDLDLYGQPEYWALPRMVDGKLYGDCEDYALEKRRQLIAAGVPESALSLAVAVTARGEGHAVLMISLKSGDWVLDNLTPWATPWEDLNYRWVERQVPGTALWTSAAA